MLDIKLIREQTDGVRAALLKRGATVDFSELLAWDEARRTALTSLEAKRNQRNRPRSRRSRNPAPTSSPCSRR
jgi:seryl-tRNA synthetase